ncbi:EamA family transporter [Trichothermofontia sichuanensis B231]|uniref:DMT family transporter n=1 Tax=Trichothermofontia sichuanensis TaxID=3045816 RepID=UPI002247EDCA|nr:DMT family transporter [Trichothermofontia sichuanensis]UZQ55506.1 EamA family transporter [Trichothermofontia sichuanensis B231]
MAQSNQRLGSGSGGLSGPAAARAADTALNAMTQELQKLQESLVAQLAQDIQWLQQEKERLVREIETLRAEHQQAFSRQELLRQQQWAKKLAQVIAAHLQHRLSEELHQLAAQTTATAQASATPAHSNGYSERAYQMIASLDATLNTTFQSLEQDLSSYQSALSQQLSRMHNLEQQGEAILTALVNRLKAVLEEEVAKLPTSSRFAPLEDQRLAALPRVHATSPLENRAPIDWTAPPPPPFSSRSYPPRPDPPLSPAATEPPATVPERSERAAPPPAVPAPQRLSPVQVGLVLILLSSFFLSLQNVVLRVILKPQLVLGWFQWGGVISPSFGNSLLILFLRVVLVLPVLALLARGFYPHVWRDLRQFLTARDRTLQRNVFGSGFCLFLSQLFIYIALGQIPTGIAITIFFIYPIVTLFLSWAFFGDRPTLFRLGITAIVLLGVGMIALSGGRTGANSLSGIGLAAAIGSGVAFAFFVIYTQSSTRRLNAVAVTLVQFATIFFCSGLILALVPLPNTWAVRVNSNQWPHLAIGVLLLALTTLAGYLSNNFGIRMAGAARSAIVGATGPAFTALLALILIGETLQRLQFLGVILVTLGVVALSFERLKSQSQTQTKPPR